MTRPSAITRKQFLAAGIGTTAGASRLLRSRGPERGLAVTRVGSAAAVSVLSAGAKGDGRSDDTAAIQHCLDGASSVYFPAVSGGYRIDGTLRPRSNQTLVLDGHFVAGSAATMWDLAGVLELVTVGSLHIIDPARRTHSRPTMRFRSGCRWLAIERIRMEGCANPIELVDVNESDFAEVHLTEVRGTGIRISDGGELCNVHDNYFGSVMIVGLPGSKDGIDYASARNGTIGGDKWGDVTLLAMGGTGLHVERAGFGEQWFDTLICDTCGLDGVRLGGGSYRFFFGRLWCASNGANGFYANGASTTALVQDVVVSQLYAHGNAGPAGVYLEGHCSGISFGSLHSLGQHTGAGLAFDKGLNGLQIGSIVTYGNGIGVTDRQDPSSAGVQIALANLADGADVAHAGVTILSKL
ncbi:MAG: Pectate lyase superfamily protein [Acidimicrobiaceae bacterium]|nr:Pectate lyase superfamily protein [Acidimicrobiaceae bacterium]